MKTRTMQRDERGFASIVIALTLVMILALLTVGFAQLVRREQRNALNKQLAVQAQYAAESGINDAVADIKDQNITSSNMTGATQCKPAAASGHAAALRTKPDTQINSTLDISYTCVSIDLDPPKLLYSKVGDSASHSVVFSTASNKPAKTLTISWNSLAGTGAQNNSVPSPGLKPKGPSTDPGRWQDPALIEISLTPLYNMDRASLTAANMTIYAYPVKGTGDAPNYAGSTSSVEGTINAAQCTGSTHTNCSITISNIDSGAPASPPAGGYQYLLHITNHYDESTISISGTDTIGTLKFHGGQAIIDSTGRARGVLKRLQVHVPLADSPVLPNYAIEATTVCKRLQTQPSGTAFVDVSGGTAAAGSACDGESD